MENSMILLQTAELQKMTIEDLGSRAAAIAMDIDLSANRTILGMISLGELLKFVKEKSEFGQYGNYGRFLSENGIPERKAQQSVQLYTRFSARPDIVNRMGSLSKLTELLALPEGEEDRFLSSHDVENMSVRGIRQEIKAARGADKTMGSVKISPSAQEREKEALYEKELAALRAEKEAANRALEAMKKKNAEAERAFEHEAKAREADALRSERLNTMLEKSSEKLRAAQDEIIALRRQKSREEEKTERTDGVTAEQFQQAVRRLMGECCDVPQMGQAFSTMDIHERGLFVRVTDRLESYVKSVRRALEEQDGEADVR